MSGNPSSANDPNEEKNKKNPYIVNHKSRNTIFSAQLEFRKKDLNRQFINNEVQMLTAARKYISEQLKLLETAYKNDPNNSEKKTAYDNMKTKRDELEKVKIAVATRGYDDVDGGGNKGGRHSKKRSIKCKRRRSSRKGRSSRRN